MPLSHFLEWFKCCFPCGPLNRAEVLHHQTNNIYVRITKGATGQDLVTVFTTPRATSATQVSGRRLYLFYFRCLCGGITTFATCLWSTLAQVVSSAYRASKGHRQSAECQRQVKHARRRLLSNSPGWAGDTPRACTGTGENHRGMFEKIAALGTPELDMIAEVY